MVPYAGYSLPVLFEPTGVVKEHKAVREDTGMFDVSHMGQVKIMGDNDAVTSFLESAIPADIKGLPEGTGCLSLICNESGGIEDDCIISKAKEGYFYLVVNGACKHKDLKILQDLLDSKPELKGAVEMNYLAEEFSLLALQGPNASKVLQNFMPSGVDLTRMNFMDGVDLAINGIENCRLTRCGYTGEDGFELSVPAAHAVSLSSALKETGNVMLCGLACRDSLRLEAGLCLYGNDLNDTINPVEASLVWVLGKKGSRRRVERSFTGAEKFLTEGGGLAKTGKKRIGLAGMKSPAREGTKIFDATGAKQIGEVTSGTFSPSLSKPIAMGYVEKDHSKAGTDINVEVRGKMQKASIEKLPFVEGKYYRAP